jgi:hypothetical protein
MTIFLIAVLIIYFFCVVYENIFDVFLLSFETFCLDNFEKTILDVLYSL